MGVEKKMNTGGSNFGMSCTMIHASAELYTKPPEPLTESHKLMLLVVTLLV